MPTEPTDAEIIRRAHELHLAECFEGCSHPLDRWLDYARATIVMPAVRWETTAEEIEAAIRRAPSMTPEGVALHLAEEGWTRRVDESAQSEPRRPSKRWPRPLLLPAGEDRLAYMGPLGPAYRLASRDRTIWHHRREDGKYVVLFCDEGNDVEGAVAESGVASTLTTALRYALGAMFGPLDETYDEQTLMFALENSEESEQVSSTRQWWDR